MHWIKRINTIVYCEKWLETVAFYEHQLELTPSYRSEWFVEFEISESAGFSVADASCTTIKSGKGKGITLSFQVDRLEKIWNRFSRHGLEPTPVKTHSMNARVFYLYDPEGHRIEFWEKSDI